jgi:hypothetical protein
MSDTLRSSIYAALSSATPITDIVGEHIYPVQATQRTAPPYIVFTRVSGSAEATTTGPSNDRESRIQIDIYSRGYAAADELRTEIVDLLHGQTGPLAATDVWVALLDFTDESWQDDDQLYRISLDFRVVYSIPPASTDNTPTEGA